MLIMERSMELPQILESVKGRKVAIWTCNTCARLCNGMGGDAAAERLAQYLRDNGVEVTGTLSTSASCLRAKVAAKSSPVIGSADVIISMTCDVGADNARKVFGKEVLEPFVTLGTGFLDEDGVPFLKDGTPVSGRSSPLL